MLASKRGPITAYVIDPPLVLHHVSATRATRRASNPFVEPLTCAACIQDAQVGARRNYLISGATRQAVAKPL
ncbi:hypothetical protein NMY22_g9593 [Coprinellus aureogranulatus]|nr:hypothetical protein NMY22_g9593 [Coprinellus aureogranulatus]